MKLSSFLPLSISLALASVCLAQAGAGQTLLTEEDEAKIGAGGETFQYQSDIARLMSTVIHSLFVIPGHELPARPRLTTPPPRLAQLH